MANEQNLVPNSKRTPNERRENAKKAGKASAKARRERKQLKDELLLLLEDGDTQEKMCLSLIAQARRGNTKAFEIVRDTIGEKPVESIEVSRNTSEIIDEIEKYVNGDGS